MFSKDKYIGFVLRMLGAVLASSFWTFILLLSTPFIPDTEQGKLIFSLISSVCSIFICYTSARNIGFHDNCKDKPPKLLRGLYASATLFAIAMMPCLFLNADQLSYYIKLIFFPYYYFIDFYSNVTGYVLLVVVFAYMASFTLGYILGYIDVRILPKILYAKSKMEREKLKNIKK